MIASKIELFINKIFNLIMNLILLKIILTYLK